MSSLTIFDPTQRYILLSVFVSVPSGRLRELDALLDTGAPSSEFSDKALQFAGLLDAPREEVVIKEGMQTQKYGRLVLPQIEICSHRLENLRVYVSRFDESWGIDALIGLDFFRQIKVTIDYQRGHLVTEPYG